MKTTRFVDEARAEFLYEVEYYESSETGLGKKFISSVRKATVRAPGIPVDGQPITRTDKKNRYQPVSVFDYLPPNRRWYRYLRISPSLSKTELLA